MERLTKHQPDNFYDYGDDQVSDESINEWYYKLQCLEDIEEELDMPLNKVVDLLFKAIKNSEFYDCLTCTNVMHNERGCDGNCSHNREFSRKEILELLELEEKFRGK